MKLAKIILLFVIFVVACRAKQEKKTTFANKPTQTDEKILFTDNYAGYSLLFPNYWKIDDHSNSKNMIRADIYKDNLVGFQIRMYKAKNFRLFTDSYISQFLTDMQNHWKGTIKEEKREFYGKLNHESCKAWIYAEKQNGENWFFKEYLFQNNDKIIAFQSGIYLSYKDTYETELDKIAESFKFIK